MLDWVFLVLSLSSSSILCTDVVISFILLCLGLILNFEINWKKKRLSLFFFLVEPVESGPPLGVLDTLNTGRRVLYVLLLSHLLQFFSNLDLCINWRLVRGLFMAKSFNYFNLLLKVCSSYC